MDVSVRSSTLQLTSADSPLDALVVGREPLLSTVFQSVTSGW